MRHVDVDFYGSDEDLDVLEKMLGDAGFEQVLVNTVRASGAPIPRAITFTIKKGIGAVFKAFMASNRKRFVSRLVSEGEERTRIYENYSVDDIERLMQAEHNFNIIDKEPDDEPPNPNSEGEMGYHVGRKPPER